MRPLLRLVALCMIAALLPARLRAQPCLPTSAAVVHSILTTIGSDFTRSATAAGATVSYRGPRWFGQLEFTDLGYALDERRYLGVPTGRLENQFQVLGVRLGKVTMSRERSAICFSVGYGQALGSRVELVYGPSGEGPGQSR